MADQAGLSRLYGGIHFWPALDNGAKQGAKIGLLTVEKLKTKK